MPKLRHEIGDSDVEKHVRSHSLKFHLCSFDLNFTLQFSILRFSTTSCPDILQIDALMISESAFSSLV